MTKTVDRIALDLPEHVDVVALITPIELCSSRSRIVSRSTPCAKLECGAGVSEIVKTDALTRPQLPRHRSGGQGVASRQPSRAPLTLPDRLYRWRAASRGAALVRDRGRPRVACLL